MNKVILLGRLTDNPDVRYSQAQNGEQLCIARYTLAIDRRGKDAGADFPRCVAFGKNGEFAEKYLKKGTKIAITGRIQTGSYEKDGVKHYTTEVIIEEQEFAESKRSQEATPEAAPAEGFMDVPENAADDLPFKK
ncbi:MAG: single-stranded DNA-binding protein [Clostridia bacterium]|nr:single-stranded DNA-binding protein [Clostridia bacterium]